MNKIFEFLIWFLLFFVVKIFRRGKDGDEKSNKGNKKHLGTIVGHWLLLQLVASIMLS